MAKKLSTQPQKIIQRAQRQQQRQQAVEAGAQKYPTPSGKYTQGVGRRKTATAQVRIYPQSEGKFVVNDQLGAEYFHNVAYAVKIYQQPFALTNTQDKFAVRVQVSGSGLRAQLEAVVHGLARALVQHDPALKPLLKTEGLLTRDARMKETRKPGRGGKARRKRQSPKR